MKIRFVLQNNQYFILDISCVLLLHIYIYIFKFLTNAQQNKKSETHHFDPFNSSINFVLYKNYRENNLNCFFGSRIQNHSIDYTKTRNVSFIVTDSSPTRDENTFRKRVIQFRFTDSVYAFSERLYDARFYQVVRFFFIAAYVIIVVSRIMIHAF